MRLVTLGKYLIGLVAASSAAVVIGGSALAAESSQVTLLSPDKNTTLDTHVSSDLPNDSSITLNNTTNTLAQTSTTTVKSTGNASVSVSDTPGDSQASPSAHNSAPVSGLTQGNDYNALASQAGVASGAAPASKDGGAIAAGSANSAAPGQLAAGSEAAPKVSEAPVTVAAVAAVREAVLPTVLTGEQFLVIQPVITAHPVTLADLASTLPSAPQSNTVPVPAHSTGLLSALGTGLVATAVSAIVLPQTSIPAGTIPVLCAALAASGLLGLVLTVGSWTRRGGFVTAPRSDVAAQQSSFATPSLMDYAAAWLQSHNPFLILVSDTKTLPVTFVTL